MKKLKLEIIGNCVYIEGIPAFMLCVNGEKDPITPYGMTLYMNNKEFVDSWVIRQFI